MGILADFFIGNDEIAKSIEDTSSISASDKIEARNVLDLYVGYLYQISEGKETSYDKDLGFETMSVFDHGERITTKVPDSFVTILCNSTKSDIEKWAEEWANQEELMWPVEDAINLIEDIKRLSIKAKQKGLSVYLWNCV